MSPPYITSALTSVLTVTLDSSFSAVHTVLLTRATEPALEEITSLLSASAADPGSSRRMTGFRPSPLSPVVLPPTVDIAGAILPIWTVIGAVDWINSNLRTPQSHAAAFASAIDAGLDVDSFLGLWEKHMGGGYGDDAATAVMEFMDDANGKTLNDEQKKKLKDFISLLPQKGVSNPDGEDISKDDLTVIAKKNTALDDDDVERVHIAAPVHGSDDDDTDDYCPPHSETPPHTPAVSITNSGPEAILLAIIAAMDPAGVNLSVFFAALGCFAMQGRCSITVFPEGVMFTSDGSRTFMTKRLKKDLAHFALMSKWARYWHGDNELSLAMFCTWTQNPVACKTTDDVAGDGARPKPPMELHAVIIATIHPLVDGARKVIAICDPNVIPLDNRLDSLSSITRKSHLVKLFLEHEKKFSRVPYFINIPRRERNTGGHCLALVLEWMVELIVYGLNVTRDGAGNVAAIEGFRPLRVLQASA
ncbi:hypothetical protein B0H10DRAFT_2224498 [Mycena sp. CBHHK59/15]|nr:hypothetical protein B0H10DRAFT_2224498 [Mycena sp. CBHHK59/15]